LKETALKEKLLMDKKKNIKIEELITLAERLEKNLSLGSETVSVKATQVITPINTLNNNQTPNNNLNTNNNNRNQSNLSNQSNTNNNSYNYNNVKCYNCGRMGHYIRDCKYPRTSGRPSSSQN
jgi:hypothetical protein